MWLVKIVEKDPGINHNISENKINPPLLCCMSQEGLYEAEMTWLHHIKRHKKIIWGNNGPNYEQTKEWLLEWRPWTKIILIICNYLHVIVMMNFSLQCLLDNYCFEKHAQRDIFNDGLSHFVGRWLWHIWLPYLNCF